MSRLSIALFALLLATITQSATSAAGSIHPFADVAVSFRCAPHGAHPGNTVAYSVDLANRGSSVAQDVILTIEIDRWIEPITAPPPGGMNCNLNLVDGQASTYVCRLEAMPPKNVYAVPLSGHLRLDTPVPTFYQSMTTVTTSTDDLEPANNIAVTKDETTAISQNETP